MSASDLNAFLAWAEENEIHWDRDAIEIREGKHGLGIYAKKDLQAGYEAIQVPKTIVLSVRSTGIANLLEEEDIEGYVGLTLACMYEHSKGKDSLWSVYLSLLDSRRPFIASDLSEDVREIMKKSEVYGEIETDLKDMREDYDSIVIPFLAKHPDIFTEEVKERFFSFEHFRLMTAHVSSRAMDVDNFHVSALVPFADLVNHEAEPNSDYLTHEDVCDICGALSCEHLDELDSDEEEDDEEAPELSGASKKRAAAKKAQSGSDDDEEDSDDEDWEDEINDTCDIILDEDVKKGEEITRHYGPFPNKIFLSKYGFAEIDNAHDTATIQIDMVKKTALAIVGDEALVEERLNWFLENEDTFISEDDPEEDGCCGGDHDHDHDHDHEHGHSHAHTHEKKEAEDDDSDEEEEEEEEDEDDFPRDIMYMMHDGTIDDRLLMLLNVIFMEKDQFVKIQDSLEVATEYFNDIFLRRALEEEDGLEEDEEEPKPEVKPLDETGRRIRKAVLEAILKVIHLRADAYKVSDQTSAEDDLEALKKSGLTGPAYYGEVCAVGEKQIIQSGLKLYSKLLSEL
ncbi:hypothetical protein BX616_003876 [Lobosporangium transversale]|uniref:Uncharacterized protein n=1 Tax=Lobosporangium transversale TaxID=64571 RepID=A0A1Y2H084_9FUNG|nr:hypothetical protein BCR41DRAFT_419188 [Lobosporangium transversale]KAF9898559.1 hypothetical protein BX616_003876 [Lobosporangium transversale]ORZ27411.1 hypothetical protein BCR41DRAFT_419188 [Lobosporangium transversale]|eukprot:XP_021885138.1 hypothetical protein BCR41DRAFT_419188 [Lobosporangium transversale]